MIDVESREISPLDTDSAIESIVLSPDNLRAYLVRVDTESGIWMLEIH